MTDTTTLDRYQTMLTCIMTSPHCEGSELVAMSPCWDMTLEEALRSAAAALADRPDTENRRYSAIIQRGTVVVTAGKSAKFTAGTDAGWVIGNIERIEVAA